VSFHFSGDNVCGIPGVATSVYVFMHVYLCIWHISAVKWCGETLLNCSGC